jgi:hypothetical protein
MPPRPFSRQLEEWLNSHHPKTIAGLITASGEKSFAMVFLVLMAIPALPIPTGGVTHVFEVIVMLLALELVAGRQTIWLPKKWMARPLGKTLETRTLPYLIAKIGWLEKYSHPRLSELSNNRQYLRLVGVVVIIFTLAAFISPPFSGLDTLPSLGVVGIALSLILEDFIVFVASLMIGSVGIVVDIVLGAAITGLWHRFF